MYYIKRNDGFYYTNNKTQHWVRDISKAQRFKNAQAATNFGLTAFKGSISYNIVSEKGEEVCAAPAPLTTESFSEKDFSIMLSLVEKFGEVAEKLPQMLTYYNNIVSEQDKLQEDLLHKIEFTSSFKFITHFKLNQKLQKCRLARRDAKNKLSYLTAINITTSLPKLLSLHQQSLEQLSNQKYTPRIAPELLKKKK